MSENYLRGKARTSILLDEDDTPLLRLLRDLFIEHDAPYCVKALASDLGVSVFTVYKMFGADRPLRAETLLHIIHFVNEKNAADTRLLDFICESVGYTPMPQSARMNLKSVREILNLAQAIVKEG
jgi:AraC-like DNA-binding protein